MERLAAELKKYKRILVDINLFIYLMEKHSQYYTAGETFTQIKKGSDD